MKTKSDALEQPGAAFVASSVAFSHRRRRRRRRLRPAFAPRVAGTEFAWWGIEVRVLAGTRVGVRPRRHGRRHVDARPGLDSACEREKVEGAQGLAYLCVERIDVADDADVRGA